MNRVSGYSLDHDGSSSSSSINGQDGKYTQYGEATIPEMIQVEKEKMKEGSSSSGEDSTSVSGSSNSDDKGKKKEEKQKTVGVTEIVSFVMYYINLNQLYNWHIDNLFAIRTSASVYMSGSTF